MTYLKSEGLETKDSCLREAW